VLPAVLAVRLVVGTLTTLAVLVEILFNNLPLLAIREAAVDLREYLATGSVAEMPIAVLMLIKIRLAAGQGSAAEGVMSHRPPEVAAVVGRSVTVQMVLAQTALAAQVTTF
jgi:hypothetical protein